MGCQCSDPLRSPDPRHADSCNACGRRIEGEWVVNDKTHNAFLDRVEQALAAALQWPDGEPPAEWGYFRRVALSREQAGRERFGFDYLERDNIAAGAEEAMDGVNYTYFAVCQALHRGEDVEWDLALTAAYHDFMAYRTRLMMQAKRRGTP